MNDSNNNPNEPEEKVIFYLDDTTSSDGQKICKNKRFIIRILFFHRGHEDDTDMKILDRKTRLK
jgi:hypothetical protein